MISLPLPPEIEQRIEQLSDVEKKALSVMIQAFLTQPDSKNFPEIGLIGPPLSANELEQLAASMEADNDLLNEPEAEAYLTHLKSSWSK